MADADALTRAFGAYQRGDHAACLALLDADRTPWAPRPDGWLLCGVALRHLGRLAEAEAAYRQALALKADYAEAWQNLGNLYAACARHEPALDAYGRALDGGRAPTDAASLLVAMSASAFSFGRIDPPWRPSTALSLSRQDRDRCGTSRASSCGNWATRRRRSKRSARRPRPTPATRCSPPTCCWSASSRKRTSEAELSALAREAATRIARQVPETLRAEYRPPGLGGRIRVAYVSSDFRASAPGFFIRASSPDTTATRFEVWLLSTVPGGDHLTDAMRAHADHWEDVSALDAEALTRFIRGLCVQRSRGPERLHRRPSSRRVLCPRRPDAGHVARLRRFDPARGHGRVPGRPPDDATGKREPASASACCVCPSTFACYSPPDYAPIVAPTPALARGLRDLRFLQQAREARTARARHCGRAVLNAVPGSRLLVKWRHATTDFARKRILDALARGGVAPERVEFRDATPHSEMLGEYGDVDIALDPTPFSGGATTCDALWMGVPVVTLHGRRFASNHTVSHLRAAGLPELVAIDEDAYVAICARLAGGPAGVVAAARGLRAAVERLAAVLAAIVHAAGGTVLRGARDEPRALRPVRGTRHASNR